jgi:hypothetical protein
MAWFRIRVWVGLTPPCTPAATRPVTGSERACPREHDHPSFRQLLTSNDSSSEGLLALDFPTLTTTALYRSDSGWFETCLKADPEGPHPHLPCSFTTRTFLVLSPSVLLQHSIASPNSVCLLSKSGCKSRAVRFVLRPSIRSLVPPCHRTLHESDASVVVGFNRICLFDVILRSKSDRVIGASS